MFTISALMSLVEAYSKASGLAEATISSRLFNDGKRLSEVRQGADIGVRRIERAVTWLSANWPTDAEWPAGVPRPGAAIPEAAE